MQSVQKQFLEKNVNFHNVHLKLRNIVKQKEQKRKQLSFWFWAVSARMLLWLLSLTKRWMSMQKLS